MPIKKLFLFLFLVACSGGTFAENNIGAEYLGAKYISDPLGEETGYDSDPLIRTDAFDCMTFVETVLADGDKNKLIKIRYKNGKIAFTNRNHFIETDWLNNNHNIIENISNQFDGAKTRHITIDKQSWFNRVYNVHTDFVPESTDIKYIPYENLQDIKNTAPLIVLFVVGKSKNTAKIGTDMAIVHMGFLLPGGKILRHASSSAGAVVDTDFAQYIAKRKHMPNNIGIALVKIK